MEAPSPAPPLRKGEAERKLAALRQTYPEIWRLRGVGERNLIEREMLRLEEIIERRTLESVVQEERGEKSFPEEPKTEPEVAKRRAIVRQNQTETARGMCGVFDEAKVPLPSGWQEDFSVQSWEAAYRNPQLRGRIQAMISKDRRAH